MKEDRRARPGLKARRDPKGLLGRGQDDVYWAGSQPDHKLEVTLNGRGDVFVRYLTEDALVGDERADFTTVATYRRDDAFELATRRGEADGMVSKTLPNHGVAVWSSSRPTSVYLAYPGSGLLIEVYDPSARRAERLVVSGDIVPVR